MRLRQGEESASDAVPDPESDTVSTDTDDPALSQQTLAQVTLAHTQAVGNISIVRSDHKKGKQPPKEPVGPARSVLLRGGGPVQVRVGSKEEGQVFSPL